MSAWVGDSKGVEHVHLRLPGIQGSLPGKAGEIGLPRLSSGSKG
jgi:hypothetical protein